MSEEGRPGRRERSRRGRRRRGARLRAGEAIALFSAVALFVVMFVNWYGAEVSGQARTIELGGGSGAGGDAWQSVEVLAFYLLLTILVTVAAALLRLTGSKWRPLVPLSAAVAVLGGIAALSILGRILFLPDFGFLGGVPVYATLKLGVFLGLAAAAGIAYGGYRAMGEEGASFAGIADGLSRPSAASPKRRSRLREPLASKKRSRSSSD